MHAPPFHNDQGYPKAETRGWFRRTVLPALVTAVVYWAVGRISLTWALPPGYSTMIWLPAGVALLAGLIRGKAVLPGVLLGSFAVNALHPYLPVTSTSLINAAGIGTGAMLQTLAGMYLIKRHIDLRDGLRSAAANLKFFLLCGPVTCLVNATLSCGVLWLTQTISTPELWLNFATWWVGDAVGAMTLAPFAFVFALTGQGNSARTCRQRFRVLLATVVPCFLVTFGLFYYVQSTEQRRITRSLTPRYDVIIKAIETTVTRYTDLLYFTRSLFTGDKFPGRAEFRRTVKDLLPRYPGLLALSWIPVLSGSQRTIWEQAADAEGLQDFIIHAGVGAGKTPAPEEAWHKVIYYNVNPDDSNTTLGFDLNTHAERRRALEAAELSGKPEPTAMLRLAIAPESSQGAAIYLAIRQGEMQHPLLAANSHPVMSYVSLALNINVLIENVIRPWLDQDFNLVVREKDGEPGSENNRLVFAWTQPGETIQALHQEVIHQVSGITATPWIFAFSPAAAYVQANHSYMPWMVLIGGMCATAMAIGFVLTLTGRTEAMQAEILVRIRAEQDLELRNQQLQDREADLEAARSAAEAASAAKSAFLANMSHEIRTPLSAVLGFASLLSDRQLPPDLGVKYQEAIRRNGSLLNTIISDILDLSAIEAGKLTIEPTTVVIRDVCQDVENILRPQAETKGLIWHLKLADDTPVTIQSDPNRIRQILINIIGNAIKFTTAGRIGIRIGPDPGRPHLLKFEVDDTGPGITHAMRDQLFKPFSQLDTTITRQYGGTGLGLAIARLLARFLGGDVSLAWSEPGQGSRFVITIAKSLQSGTESTLPAALPQPETAARGARLTGWRVLVADDTPDNRTVLTMFLSAAGAITDTAENGREALERLESATFDAVLMDLQMPVMDGIEAFREIRRRGITTPVLAVTAHAGEPSRRQCLDLGFDGVVIKPVSRDELTDTIATVVAKRAGATAPG